MQRHNALCVYRRTWPPKCLPSHDLKSTIFATHGALYALSCYALAIARPQKFLPMHSYRSLCTEGWYFCEHNYLCGRHGYRSACTGMTTRTHTLADSKRIVAQSVHAFAATVTAPLNKMKASVSERVRKGDNSALKNSLRSFSLNPSSDRTERQQHVGTSAHEGGRPEISTICGVGLPCEMRWVLKQRQTRTFEKEGGRSCLCKGSQPCEMLRATEAHLHDRAQGMQAPDDLQCTRR